MAICFVTATALTPRATWYSHINQPDFDAITPTSFGDWKLDTTSGNSGVVDPQVQDKIASIYTQTVSRVYVHQTTGRRIMLSIAYGDRQTFGNQLHRPESCYSSQGFAIKSLNEVQIPILGAPMNMARMYTTLGNRQEYVSYFIRVGDRILRGPSTALNKARLSMGLGGYVADGLLFRVSEITSDEATTYALQDNFMSQLFGAVAPDKLVSFIPQGGSSP